MYRKERKTNELIHFEGRETFYLTGPPLPILLPLPSSWYAFIGLLYFPLLPFPLRYANLPKLSFPRRNSTTTKNVPFVGNRVGSLFGEFSPALHLPLPRILSDKFNRLFLFLLRGHGMAGKASPQDGRGAPKFPIRKGEKKEDFFYSESETQAPKECVYTRPFLYLKGR